MILVLPTVLLGFQSFSNKVLNVQSFNQIPRAFFGHRSQRCIVGSSSGGMRSVENNQQLSFGGVRGRPKKMSGRVWDHSVGRTITKGSSLGTIW